MSLYSDMLLLQYLRGTKAPLRDVDNYLLFNLWDHTTMFSKFIFRDLCLWHSEGQGRCILNGF